jgi:hypothetical protein
MISEQELRRRLGLLRSRGRRPQPWHRGSRAAVGAHAKAAGVPRSIRRARAGRRTVRVPRCRAAREAGRPLARGIELRRVLEAAVAAARQPSRGVQARRGRRGSCANRQRRNSAVNSRCGPTMTAAASILVAAAEKAEESSDLDAENLHTALRADANDRSCHSISATSSTRRGAWPRPRSWNSGRPRPAFASVVQPRHGGRGRRAHGPRHRRISASCRRGPTTLTRTSIWLCC